ncbi:MAG: sugar phosphate isomerase/epimerase family protein [Anaerolineae bacterium]|nr:sugar phosphate isomerase/epimerase [Anaerolineae bacterium]MDW8067833.1 sugar phosphate isomerase/epimerase family protein [Anaerolineae bacterium]
MERLAIATRRPDIAPYVALARNYGVGIEIQVYGYTPDLLDGDWSSLVKEHRRLLRGFGKEIALHGAFYDMNSASEDRQIVRLTRERYLTCLRIAAELGAHHVIFHANYLPWIRNPAYLHRWTGQQVEFWSGMAVEAERLGVVVALENMWEPNPDLVGRVLDGVNSPFVTACLDVGHVYLYSDSVPLAQWVIRLGDRLTHCHINNHRGAEDEHLALNVPGGVVDYRTVFPLLRNLPSSPLLSLEMDRLEDMEQSLRFILEMQRSE